MTSVVLRPFTAADVPALDALFAEAVVRQWNPVRSDAATWWPSANDHDDSSRTWAVADPTDGRLLGTVAVFGARGASAEVGYRVRGSESGRGVATAAVTEAVARAEVALSLAHIRLVHAVANPASCRVALKAGFRSEHTTAGTEVYGDGRLYDEHVHLYRRLLGPDEFRGTYAPGPAGPVGWPDVDRWE